MKKNDERRFFYFKMSVKIVFKSVNSRSKAVPSLYGVREG